jgi:hypothetical protein
LEAWLEQRHYTDLDPRAERALRSAGLLWHDEARAEQQLSEAADIAPGHMAVTIAHYRYYLYKHRFEEARRYAELCLALSSTELGLPSDPQRVTKAHADFAAADPRLRFWLFALQAYGYVLLRCGQHDAGLCVLGKVVDLDSMDETRTRMLIMVINRSREDRDSD